MIGSFGSSAHSSITLFEEDLAGIQPKTELV